MSNAAETVLTPPNRESAIDRVRAARLELMRADPLIGNVAGWHVLTEHSAKMDEPDFLSTDGTLRFDPSVVEYMDQPTLVAMVKSTVETGIQNGAIPETVVAAVRGMIEDR